MGPWSSFTRGAEYFHWGPSEARKEKSFVVCGFRTSKNGLSRQDRAGSLGDTDSWGPPHRQHPPPSRGLYWSVWSQTKTEIELFKKRGSPQKRMEHWSHLEQQKQDASPRQTRPLTKFSKNSPQKHRTWDSGCWELLSQPGLTVQILEEDFACIFCLKIICLL